MITSALMRAAQAMPGPDRMGLAELAGLLLPTDRRLETSGRRARGIIGTLMPVVEALDAAGIELIAEHMPLAGHGSGVRLRVAAAWPEERHNGRVGRKGVAPESACHVA